MGIGIFGLSVPHVTDYSTQTLVFLNHKSILIFLLVGYNRKLPTGLITADYIVYIALVETIISLAKLIIFQLPT